MEGEGRASVRTGELVRSDPIGAGSGSPACGWARRALLLMLMDR